VREDGQKVLLAVKNMGGETSQAWRAVLDDLVKRGLRQPEFLIVDGGTGLEQALLSVQSDKRARSSSTFAISWRRGFLASDVSAKSRIRYCASAARPSLLFFTEQRISAGRR
jgi:hypothetical protein